jgi:hypothetical protein
MRGAARWTALASITFSLSCSHWYTRAGIATVAGAAWGAGLGAIIPCSDMNPNCQPAQSETLGAVGIFGALGFWAIGELIFATHTDPYDYNSSYTASSSDDSSSGSTSSSDDTSGGDTSSSDDSGGYASSGDDTSSGGETPSGGETQSDDPNGCHTEYVGPGQDYQALEPLRGGRHVSATDYTNRTTPLEACDAAKDGAFLSLRTQCSGDGELTQWIVYHQMCECQYCPHGEVGDARAHCSVTVQGACTSGAHQPQFGYAIESSEAYANEVAENNARLRCYGSSGETRQLGCDTEQADQGTQVVTMYACTVAVDCDTHIGE